jgi:N-acetylmuramoyl-L-alanine amidase
VHRPERIAVDLPRTRLATSSKPRTIAEGPVRRIRINRLSWGTQVVLDLRSRASWKDFTLPPTRNKHHRIVLDLTPRSTEPTPPSKEEPILVAVDAGHGGMDPGARGRYGLVEKDITLQLAKLVARRIDATPGFRAMLVRRDDRYLSLTRRREIARKARADAFVSIHLNAAPNRAARGAEVFFVTPGGAEQRAQALLKNRRRAAEELGFRNVDDRNLLSMLVDLKEKAVLARSSLLAESILKALRRSDLPPTRAVRQRSFAVLKTIAMPSVIVEAGFITNRHDARILRSKKGRDALAGAIADGIVRYFRKYPPPKASPRRVVVHRVRRGDTLWKIARRYGVSVASLREINRLGRSDLLRVGQEILVMGAD